MFNVTNISHEIQANLIIHSVEILLKEHDQLDKYDVGVEWYDEGDQNYTIILKDLDTGSFTVLDPELLGIEL